VFMWDFGGVVFLLLFLELSAFCWVRYLYVATLWCAVYVFCGCSAFSIVALIVMEVGRIRRFFAETGQRGTRARNAKKSQPSVKFAECDSVSRGCQGQCRARVGSI